MKYNKECYIGSGIYSDDDSVTGIQEKIVKCRKEYICPICQNKIKKGEYALYEKAFLTEGTPVNCHTCLPCIEKWLEESGQVDEEDVN